MNKQLPHLTPDEIEAIRQRCKNEGACNKEYRRLLDASTPDKVWRVLLDNVFWVLCHDILTPEQRTPEVCLAAVQHYGLAVQYLAPEQRTPEVCLAAVRQNGLAVHCLAPEQRTPEVCLAAVQQDGWAVQYLTPEQRQNINQ
jgi:hypothetical protein